MHWNQEKKVMKDWKKIGCCLGIAFAALAAAPATAQQFPTKPIKFVVPFPAGSSTDLSFRPVAEHMSATLGQNVIMDFRPGGATLVGAQYTKTQPGDGYTFMIGTPSLVVVSLKPGSEIDIRRDFQPIATTTVAPLVLAVNTEQVKATTVKELIEEARAKPGQINYASYGIGSGAHIYMELLQYEAKVKMVHVPYQGSGQATTDTAVGRTQVTPLILATAHAHVASLGGSGKLRLIAVSSAERSALAPDVPGMKEAGYPQIDVGLWGGFIGPLGMPKNAVDALARATTAAYKDPKIIEVVRKAGIVPVYGGPDQLARVIANDYNATQRLIKEAGIKLD
jgi:tripartite-type tricarboxylate transporter receptor subunit TctC